MFSRKQFALLLAIALTVIPFIVAHAAGGQLKGTVSDQKGSVIAGASVTVTAVSAADKKHRATTDDRGRYQIEGLPPGVYLVTVKAAGFSEARREGVAVSESRPAHLDINLEVAPVEGLVPVMSGAP